MLSDSDSEDVHQFTINKHYAKAYEYKKEREELSKLKEKYGSDAEDIEDSEDSEDAETEDEDGEELTPAVDAAILRTLARIKRKDPAIYELGKDVFEEEKARTGDAKISKRKKEDKSKPLTIRQHALASTLKSESRSPSPEPPTHVQEQEDLKKETVQAFHTAVPDAEEDELLVLREKTKDEVEREEEEYKQFLQREVGEDLKGLITINDEADGDVGYHGDDGEDRSTEKKKKKKKTKEKGVKSNEDDDHQFLLDYILNRGWIDQSTRRHPTYKEITASSSKKKGKVRQDEGTDTEGSVKDEGSADDNFDEDDAEFEEVAERFESSYNFRFEEPDAATIARYPRNITSGVRREDTSRKEARERRKTRKEEELLQKREEIKRLKALKMKELRAKLEKIGREGGMSVEDEALRELDLEAEWDPQAHDRQMTELYGQDGEGVANDDDKPTWDDDIDIADIIPAADEASDKKKKKKKKKKKGGEDEMDDGGVDVDEMDADKERLSVQGDEPEWDGTEEMRKRVLDQYMDKLHKMEINDLVGDIPTRFHYTPVQSTSYSLTPVEILLSTDAELNQFMGIKKYAPYREKKQDGWDHSRNDRLSELKEKLQGRRWGTATYGNGSGNADGEMGVGGETKPKKRKGKKERMKLKANTADDAPETKQGSITDEPTHASSKKRVLSDDEDEADKKELHTSEGPSKKRRRRHKKSGAVQDS